MYLGWSGHRLAKLLKNKKKKVKNILHITRNISNKNCLWFHFYGDFFDLYHKNNFCFQTIIINEGCNNIF